ncbi:B12-binding domain-containing radical SAM protein [Bradyrhizobium australafricanum]|uniref:B12-binding domain-containing radical SAM protein n=1 Tax=Bradyrhizobium australafricanum TaxID=2821406 RepID=UPI001CE2D4C8|nr:radical SAM protein [Bradyrhizobium australafricanum]MCA6098179.1 B12-binding domain-containing radical SAM protein [Bradyrhizobium australafricanum]
MSESLELSSPKSEVPRDAWRYPRLDVRRERNAIALVNVPYGADTTGSFKPLGLASLGSYLTAHGISVVGFDVSDSQKTIETIVRDFKLAEFPVVGLSFYNSNAHTAFEMARAIKHVNSSVIIIAGGPHASASHSTMSLDHPEIDIIVRNEGEEVLRDVMECLLHGISLDDVKGISGHQSGNLRINSERERLNDLDALPPPTFHFERENPESEALFFDRSARRFRQATALVTSRSCPFRCSFCAIILIGRKWRKMSAAKVVADFRALERDGQTKYEHIYFLDANFFVDYRRSLEIARALNGYRADITFSFSTRVNQLIHGQSALAELKRLGLRAVELGIESGSDAALRRFAKDVTVAENDRAIVLLKEHDIQLFLDFIMFDAETTLDDLSLNLSFLERNGLDSYVPWDHLFSYMTPYLGTEIRRHYQDKLQIELSNDDLPVPRNCVTPGAVRQIFDELWSLRPWMSGLAGALQQLERRRRTVGCRESARTALNAATIRRLPFLVLRNLVSSAKAGQIPSLRSAIPFLYRDGGTACTLEEFLNDAFL